MRPRGAAEACACAAYPRQGNRRPEGEQAGGRIEILARRVFAAEHYTEWRCRCTACGRVFTVTDTTGGHGTGYAWR